MGEANVMQRHGALAPAIKIISLARRTTRAIDQAVRERCKSWNSPTLTGGD
jgi:hypothetical protein